MSITNLGLTTGPMVHKSFVIFLYVLKSLLLVFLVLTLYPLVHTLFDLFLYMLNSPLLVFWDLKFSHLHESIPNVVNPFHYFCAQIEVWYFPSKFQNRFYSFIHYSLILRPHSLQSLRFVLQHDPPRSNG